MEYNELVQAGDFWELRHVRDYPSEKGHIIIARFNSALVRKAQAGVVARLLGYQLPISL